MKGEKNDKYSLAKDGTRDLTEFKVSFGKKNG